MATTAPRNTHRTHKAVKPGKYTNALEQILPVKDRTRLMLLSVLRNRTGLKLQDQFRAQSKDFDWDEFKAQFNADYSECSPKQLMRLLNEKFGFHTVEEVRTAYLEQSKIRRSRQAQQVLEDYDVEEKETDYDAMDEYED
ncbi:MAG: hypothetical protein KME45_31920 [Stenomitos rutilans HA7619-LM2]|jgi:hypothetical protein|nr:hypothetical protein [Stenomitos rutilans HA7619-LM2]